MATRASTTVGRAFEVLDLFRNHATLGVSECAELSGLARPTAHRLLVSLVAAGALERTDTHRYRLALNMFELGARVPVLEALHACAEPEMADLVFRTGLQAHLSVRRGLDVVYLLMLNRDARRLQTRLGRPEPLHATAMGKVLLQGAPAAIRDQVASGPLKTYTPHTITSFRRLDEELARVSASGFAYGLEERRLGVVSVATGVKDAAGTVRAAISIPSPAGRDRDRIRALERPLRRVADRIEAALARQPSAAWSFDSDPVPAT